MRVIIHAVGRMKSGPETELLARYLDRAAKAGRQLGISELRQRELAESRRAQATSRRDEEALALASAAAPGARILLLDEKGDDLDSLAFSALLQTSLDNGVGELAFLIGGPDGHGSAARQAAVQAIRFGSTTWPHQLVRIMLAEQIYRAITILSGHPYHRE